MYASIGGGGNDTVAQMVQKVEAALAKGFKAIKIRMDWGAVRQDADPAKDLEMFRQCRKVCGGAIPLSFDPNNGYSVPTAIQQGRRFEELGIWHYEEPVAQFDYAGIAQVADALDVPVSAGEHEYTRWQFRDLIHQARVDIIQPDVVKCGGITEMKKIAVLGETYGKHFVPHQTQPTIGTAANLHCIAALQWATRPQEFTGQRPELDALFQEPLVFEDGYIHVPNRPGLGLEIDEKKLREMAV
jgi:L-alanine-DL-glutamate epimerase-like enolase superfamily enzyme